MADPFIAEIRIFAGTFAPRGWAFCDGQLLPIAQNTALFSLVGTTYGGDGRTTFAVPDLKGRVPMQWGTGPGLTPRVLGEWGGTPFVTLVEAEIPSHTHTLRAKSAFGTSDSPTNRALAREDVGVRDFIYQKNSTSNLVDMAFEALASTGGTQAHENRQPFLALYFIIALVGDYPSRN